MNDVLYAYEVWIVHIAGRAPTFYCGIASNPRQMIDKAEKFLRDDDRLDSVVVGVKQIAEIEIK